MPTHPRFPYRLVASGAALALALSASACGGSDDGANNGSTPPAATAETGQSEAQQARQTIERLYQAHRDSDPGAVCAELSIPAQKQVIQGDLGGKDVTCEESFEKFFERSEGTDQQRATTTAKVGKIKINGNHARATVKFQAGTGQVPLIKIDNQWKLDAVGAAQPAP
jgi:hypothetical protein